ncbi:MAG: 50S ribosomal protein L11 methyltransferase [Polyangiaceae bacterium]
MSDERAQTVSSEARYPYLHVVTDSADADLLSGALFELGATGVEERDDSTYVKGPGTGKVLLVASFETHDDARAALTLLEQEPTVNRVTLEEVVGDAWRDAWKEFYEPFAITPSILLCPPWREAEPSPGQTRLMLEPGRAFGTGLHATTSLVAGILDGARADLAGKTILDAGCGSGILSLIALALGAARVVAFDIDAEVLDTVRENAERNAMSERLTIFAGVIDDVSGSFPWVLANIEARILDPIAEALAARVEPGGYLVLSGILLAEEAAMTKRFGATLDTSVGRRKLELVERREASTGGARAYDKDGWVALRFRVEE